MKEFQTLGGAEAEVIPCTSISGTAGEDETVRAFGLLTLWNEDRLKVFLDDGTFEYVQVELGDLNQEEYAKAAEVLQRAIF